MVSSVLAGARVSSSVFSSLGVSFFLPKSLTNEVIRVEIRRRALMALACYSQLAV